MVNKNKNTTDEKIPEMINKYPIIKLIGKGGMGKVYLAKHPTLKRDIILKSLIISDSENEKRFKQEANIMLDFNHENIVKVYDHFKDGKSTYYIAMEYVNGKDLNKIIQENKKIPIPLALFILYQVALGLNHAHLKGVIHRDIKPHNILISVNGDIKIVDFGIATKRDSKEEVQGITKTGTIIGTPAYMSPEQFSGKKTTIDQRTDIYSLGVVFYEMITGNRPFPNEFTPNVINAIMSGKYDSVNKYLTNVPSIVKKIIRKTFNNKIKNRYNSLLPLIKLLRKYFSKYNYYEIKDSIKKLLLLDKNLLKSSFLVRYEKNLKFKKKFIVFNLLLLFSLSLISLFFITKREYEWILRDKYGKVRFEFDKVNMEQHKIEIQIKNNNFFYKEKVKMAKNDKRFSKIYYLPEGNNKFTIIYGSYINAREVYIFSLKNQKKLSLKEQLVEIPMANLWSQEVSVYFRFYDSVTQKILFQFDNYTQARLTEEKGLKELQNEEDNLKIKIKNSFISLKDYIANERINFGRAPFYSGLIYNFKIVNFKIDNNIYEDLDFQLDFSLEDRSYVTHIPLCLKPAKVIIESSSKDIPLFINNNKYILIYENNNYILKNINKISIEKINDLYIKTLNIYPGDYTYKISNNGIEKHQKFNSNKTTIIKVIKKNGKYFY